MAMQRPDPLERGMRDWQRMPSSTMLSCARICGCWLAGKMSTMRLMVVAALLVCSVASVRWPGFRDAQGGFHRFQVAHFTDEHHVRVFAQRDAQGIRE